MMALASVIRRPIYSIYPNVAFRYRALMHNVLKPRYLSLAKKSFLILKTNIGDQNFPSGDQKFWFVFRCEGNVLLTLFGDHIFPCGDWKKFLSPVGACLKKLISDPVIVTWLMLSNAALRSRRNSSVTFCLSMFHKLSLWTLKRAVSVEWCWR